MANDDGATADRAKADGPNADGARARGPTVVPADAGGSNAGGRREPGESEKARIDRELIELLNELRVTLPGIQVLFAFLLILPFQQRWATATDIERLAYFIAFLATAVASILLIAPSPYHRIRFRDEDKFDLLRFGNRMLLAATVFLAIAITTAFFLIAEVVTGALIAGALAGAAAALIVVFWYAVPVYERRKDRRAGH